MVPGREDGRKFTDSTLFFGRARFQLMISSSVFLPTTAIIVLYKIGMSQIWESVEPISVDI